MYLTIFESVAVPKILGLSTNVPVTYAAKVMIFFVLNLVAISMSWSDKKYAELGFSGCESPVNKSIS